MSILIGSHVSFRKDKQLLGCVEETISYGGNTFMFYTGAPQNTKRLKIDNSLTSLGINLMKLNNIDISNVVVHAPYIINLGNNKNAEGYNFAISFLKQEISRCETLGVRMIILHPGSHVGLGSDIGINNIINGLNTVIKPDQKVIICLETMAGKGTECGRSFEELKRIIDGVKYSDKLGICMDSCHLNDAGYDINNFNNILDEFNNVIGLDKLKVIHINDSKNVKGSGKDRHENIGYGNLGFDTIINIIYNDRIKNIPKILETPYVTENGNEKKRLYPPYKFEIEMIKTKVFNSNLLEDIRNYYKK